MDGKTKQRIEEIRERLDEYRKHKDDKYTYYQEAIIEVRQLLHNAPEDIEFLLKSIDNLDKQVKESEKFIFALGYAEGQRTKKAKK